MVRSLEIRRQRIVHELSRVNSAIAATTKRMAEIHARMAVLNQAKAKAA